MTDLEQRLKLADELLQRWDRCACQSGGVTDPRLCLKAKQHVGECEWPDESRVIRIIPF